MKHIIILLMLVCAAAGTRADLVMQQQIVTPDYNAVVTMKVKGVKVRLDLDAGQPQAVSTITDLNTGDTINLMHAQKMYVKTPGALLRQARPAVNGAAATAKPPLPRATGKTQKTGGYDAEIYTWSNPRGIAGTAWVATNFPDYARIRTDLAMLDRSTAEMNNNSDPVLSALPGMVVRSQVAGSGHTITVILLSAMEAPVDATVFQLPAGYKELPRPKPLESITQPVPKKTPGK